MSKTYLITHWVKVHDRSALMDHARRIRFENDLQDDYPITVESALGIGTVLDANYTHPMQIPDPADVGFEILDHWAQEFQEGGQNETGPDAPDEHKASQVLRELLGVYDSNPTWVQNWMKTCNLLDKARAAISGSRRPKLQAYSVLLLYPDYLGWEGRETFYHFVLAVDVAGAIKQAQASAFELNELDRKTSEPTDFAPLLVTRGHNYGELIEDAVTEKGGEE